jgi:hypothetical protein
MGWGSGALCDLKAIKRFNYAMKTSPNLNLRPIPITIGILPQDKLRERMQAVAMGELKVKPSEPKFDSPPCAHWQRF